MGPFLEAQEVVGAQVGEEHRVVEAVGEVRLRRVLLCCGRKTEVSDIDNNKQVLNTKYVVTYSEPGIGGGGGAEEESSDPGGAGGGGGGAPDSTCVIINNYDCKSVIATII